MKQLKARLISEVEARQWLHDAVDAEYMPHRVIASSGVLTIHNWLAKVARIPQDTIAWITQAEDTANNDFTDYVVIELRAHSTVSGRPETLHVPNHDFVWYINELQEYHTCQTCAGSGFDNHDERRPCSDCDGDGQIEESN